MGGSTALKIAGVARSLRDNVAGSVVVAERETPSASSARGIAAMRLGQPVCMQGAPEICSEAIRGMN